MPVLPDDLFLMANLSPTFTGLPFVVWITTCGGAHRDIHVNISREARAKPEEFISVALRPEVRPIEYRGLSENEISMLGKWVNQNWDTLLAYWNGEMFTEEVIATLRPLGTGKSDRAYTVGHDIRCRCEACRDWRERMPE